MALRPKILLVTPCSPFSPQSGAEQRSALLYEALSNFGEVHVLKVLATESETYARHPEDSRILLELAWRQPIFGLTKYQPQDFFFQNGLNAEPDYNNYDLIVSRYLNPICKLHIPPSVPTIVDLDDWRKTFCNDGGQIVGKIIQRLKQVYSYWLSKRQLKRFDGFFFVSDRDRETEPSIRSRTLVNIVFSAPQDPFPDAANTHLLFVGSLWYAPNAHGIDHFLKCCWPTIKAAVPSATLTLAGAAPAKKRQEWELNTGVSAPGFVDDLEAVYRSAVITIAPIYSGGGSNIKVIESLAFGRACVTTRHCAAAFENDLVHGGAIAIGSSDSEFTNHCIRLITDAKIRCQQAIQGHGLVRKQFNRFEFSRVVLGLVEAVLTQRDLLNSRR